MQIEQQQLAAFDVMSNPVLQLAREHLLAAKHYRVVTLMEQFSFHSEAAKDFTSTRYDDDETTHDK